MNLQANTNDRRRLSRRRWIAAALAAVLLAAVFFYFDLQRPLTITLQWIEQLGEWGYAVFVLVYIASCLLLIPGTGLAIGAGALFGVGWGTVLSSLGATLGATSSFLVSRYLARGWVARRIRNKPVFVALDEALAEEGWKIVGLTRLSPFFPFTLLNYAFGLTSVPLRDYFLATWIGILPGTLLYAYIGSMARAAVESERHTLVEWGIYGIGLLATLVLTIVITRMARRVLSRKLHEHEPEPGSLPI